MLIIHNLRVTDNIQYELEMEKSNCFFIFKFIRMDRKIYFWINILPIIRIYLLSLVILKIVFKRSYYKNSKHLTQSLQIMEKD